MNQFSFSIGDNRTKHVLILILALCAVCMVFPAIASVLSEGQQSLDWGNMAMELAGGLSLFLFGMKLMEDALKMVAGAAMKRILARLTNNRFMGLVTGAVVTSIIQSSSVTTVLMVGFVAAGLMSLAQSLGVIMGANIGTTITAQIVAFKVTKYALLLIAGGFLLVFTGRTEKWKHYGELILGLGLIFFGMGVMSAGMNPLRTYEPFIMLMREVSNPFVGIAVAAAFTAVVQSSSATMGVVIVLAMQGLITLEAGIALAIGANVGTCITALLAAIGKPREAVRVAIAHVTFNVLWGVLAVLVITQFVEIVRYMSPVSQGLDEMARLAADTPRQIANAHTVFNTVAAVLSLPFVGLLARFCEWLVPDKALVFDEAVSAEHLDIDAIETSPSFALTCARLEIVHMGQLVAQMLERSIPAFLAKEDGEIRKISEMDDNVDFLYAAIVQYLAQVGMKELTEDEAAEMTSLLAAASDLESIGDLFETTMLTLAEQRNANDVTISSATQEVFIGLHAKLTESLKKALLSVSTNDTEMALGVINLKSEVNEAVMGAEQHQTGRLLADAPNREATYRVEMEFINLVKSIFYRIKRVAKSVQPDDVSEQVFVTA